MCIDEYFWYPISMTVGEDHPQTTNLVRMACRYATVNRQDVTGVPTNKQPQGYAVQAARTPDNTLKPRFLCTGVEYKGAFSTCLAEQIEGDRDSVTLTTEAVQYCPLLVVLQRLQSK